MTLQINVLGRLEIAGDAKLALKHRMLLAYLAVEGVTPRSRLAAFIWPHNSPEQARHSLRNAALEIRKTAIGRHLDATFDTCGLVDFECDYHRLMNVPSTAKASDLKAIANTYRGDFLQSQDCRRCEEYEEWIRDHRAFALDQVVSVLMRLTTASAPSVALAAGRRLMAIDPLNEEGCRALLRASLRFGEQRARALVEYKNHAAALMRELQIKPDSETTALARALSLVMPAPSVSVAA